MFYWVVRGGVVNVGWGLFNKCLVFLYIKDEKNFFVMYLVIRKFELIFVEMFLDEFYLEYVINLYGDLMVVYEFLGEIFLILVVKRF